MPTRAATFQSYAAFLRSRWPSRTRRLAVHAFLGSIAFVALDWIFTRSQATPPELGTIAWLRLPWALLPAAGYLLQRQAPRWRYLPQAIVALSVAWVWAAVIGYFAIGLEGSVIQAITLFAGLTTTAALLPLSGAARAGVFALMALGYVAFDLAWPHSGSMALRRADDAAVLAFAVIQIMVFQSFSIARRKAVLLRHRLERAVAELAASRQRAADAVTEVGRLAAEVAHQVNNPLSAVKVNVRWLADEGAVASHASERSEVVLETLQAIDRIAVIVLDLKRRANEQREALHQEETSTSSALSRLEP
jgi:signal transduction histidine kinase